jgi:hypothetical protein
MGFVRSLLIVLLANQASIATAVAGERTILREPDAVIGQKHPAGYATKDARVTPVTPLDRVATAVDGAESSHGKDIAMWRPDPSGPQGPMQVGEAAATDVGGGDRFNLRQNRAIGRAYLALLYGRYKNWPDTITAYNWGLSNVDTWIRAGRPPEKLLSGVAAYTTRVLYDSGLCYSTQTIQRRGSATLKGEPEFGTAMADLFTYSVLGNSDTDGGAFTRNRRYPCGTAPSNSKVGPSRLKQQGATPSQSLLEQITASARRSWIMAIRRPRM